MLLASDSKFASTPCVQSALDVARQAELYSNEQNISAALESFTSALNVLVPEIRKEPSGERKDLLQQQVTNILIEDPKLFIQLKVILTGLSTGDGVDAGGGKHEKSAVGTKFEGK